MLFDRFEGSLNESLLLSKRGRSGVGSSSSSSTGAIALRSFEHAILLRLPGTEELILLPSRNRTFRSLNFAGDATYCLGKAAVGDTASFAE
jgi:hypothetical protein